MPEPVDPIAAPSSPAGPRPRGATARLRRVERLFNRRTTSPRARNIALLIAMALFAVLTVASFTSLPDGVDFRWTILPVLLVVVTPLTIAANAAEYRVMAAANGQSVGWLASMRLTVIAGAANLLPLPGGIVIRTQALRQGGAGYRSALATNAAAGLGWTGAGAIVIAAIFGWQDGALLAVAGLLAAGLAALGASWGIVRRIDRARALPLFAQLLVVEFATVAFGGLRIYLSFVLIGLSASPAQAVAMTASGIVAAAVGIFPGGLGLREGLAGLIGEVVDLTVSEAIAATAADRVVTQATLGCMAAAVLLIGRRRRSDDGTSDAGTAEA